MAVVLRHALFEVTAIPLKQKVIGAALLELTLDVQIPHGRRALRAVHRFCFLGSCSPLSKDCVVVKLHCVGLHQFGEREGLSEQRAFGSLRAEGTFVAQAKVLRKSGCTS